MVLSSASRPVLEALDGAGFQHRPIDMVHLARQALGDRSLELEVLRMFDELAHAYCRRIQQSAGVDELVRHLHTLKGAALGIGAGAIARLAGAAEARLRAGNPVDPEQLDDIEMAVEECSAFIETLLVDEPA